MESITKEILGFLGNKHTKVEMKDDFIGNYYSHLIDTIYISKNIKKQEVPSNAKNISAKAAELVVICHECIHSIQKQSIHLLNTILSNLSIILTVICIVTGIFGTPPIWLKIVATTIIVLGIIIRLILEVGAINGSTKIAQEVVEKEIVKGISVEEVEESARYIEKNKFMALLQMVVDKIIFLILVLVIK